MSTYRIQRGDTLSGIAQRFHSTVGALLKANPQIQNANLIRAGASLNIPGSRDEFVPAPKTPARRATDSKAASTGTTLRRGSSGASVMTLQQKLKAHGFDPGPADGAFGPRTEAAVRSFQAAKGLTVDGVVGPQTWAALNGKPSSNPTPPSPGPSTNPGALANVTPQQLAQIGATDKAKFFALLKPAALEAERKYGVPWQVTLAQAALESGWGAHAIGGYNIFGIKGTGPAGTVAVRTQEWVNGRYITITDNFAKYHNFAEAIEIHGKVFHNGYYNKAINGFAADHNPVNFVNNIQGIYATSPTYAQSLLSIMRGYHLV